MTKARQLPRHGTEYRYRGPKDGSWPGCRCPECTHAQVRGGKVRRLQHLRGEEPLYPGAPLVEHIEKLHDSGMSYALIARRAKVADTTVTYLVRGVTKSCKRDIALRILAVKPADFDAKAKRPAFRSTRRVQALYAIGHNPQTIAAEADLDPYTVSQVANGRYEFFQAATERGIRTAYNRLCTIPGPSEKAKRRAAKLGWHGPLAWDDIDDPAAKPEKAAPYKPADKYRRDPDRTREIEHLYLLGESVEQIAKQLGGNQKYISDQLAVVVAKRAERAQQEKARAGLERAA